MTKTRDDAQPLTGTDPNAHNLSVLTATSDSSAQQWGAAYPPQAAYSAYGSYDYSHQIPQSAPQAAAYGAYPSTYPPQVDVKSWRSGSRNEDSHCSHCQVKCFHSSIFIGFSNC